MPTTVKYLPIIEIWSHVFIYKESWTARIKSLIMQKDGSDYKQTVKDPGGEKKKIIKYINDAHIWMKDQGYIRKYITISKSRECIRKEKRTNNSVGLSKSQIGYKRLETDVYIKLPMEWWNHTDCGTNLTGKSYGEQRFELKLYFPPVN